MSSLSNSVPQNIALLVRNLPLSAALAHAGNRACEGNFVGKLQHAHELVQLLRVPWRDMR